MYTSYYSTKVEEGGVMKKISVPAGGYIEHRVAYVRRRVKSGRPDSDSDSEDALQIDTASGNPFWTNLLLIFGLF